MIESFRKRHLTERVLGLVLLVACGSVIGYSCYQDYWQIDRLQRELLATRLLVLEKALAPQLLAVNGALNGIANDGLAGRLLAELDPVPIAGLLDALRFTPDTRITVSSGKDVSGPALDRIMLPAAPRMQVFRSMQVAGLALDPPLTLSASRDMAAVHADWRQQYQAIGWIFCGLATLAYVALLFHQRRQKAFAKLMHGRAQKLQASEAKLQSLFDATPDALLISDARGTIRMANRQVERLLGYSMEEIIGSSIDQLVPSGIRAAHTAMRARFATTPSSRQMGSGRTVTALRKDGSAFNVEISLSRIETDAELLFACALRDITERMELGANLRASEARLRAIFDNEPDCIKIVDEAGRVIDINPSGLSLIEADARMQVIGKCATDFIAPEYHERFRDLHARVLDGEAMQLVFEVVGRRGGRRWMESRAVPLLVSGRPTQLSVTRDITERKSLQDRFVQLAFYDQLTGLPNRALLAERLLLAVTDCRRSATHGALLFIDMDNFKTLKHTLGHDISRLMLKRVAQRLSDCVREGDTVARLGGDEFMVVLANLGSDHAQARQHVEAVAGSMLAALSQPYELGDLYHHGSASAGITLFAGHPGSMDDLMKQADMAMYRAKRAGRNVLRFFEPEMEHVLKQRLALEKDLRDAVSARQFILHYQPQVTELGRVTGAEVLVRWQHPQLGMVSPAEFIPVAEETGVILALGQWVLATACCQLAVWAKLPAMAQLTLAVNVSARQFGEANFVDQVQETLLHTGASPLRLKLELTESLMVGNMPDIIEKMNRIKAMGVGFSLDDFGTGYSSLSYLNRMPLDQLKIDQSFVRNVLTSPNDAAIARTIVALAQSLNLDVIAEGVETAAQRDFLASTGCKAYQGYLFSRPLPLDGFEAMFKSSLLNAMQCEDSI